MKLGKAKYSGEKKEIFKIKDGDNIYRVLPPMGKLADAGVWSRYYRVVWGYKDTKGRNRPFISPRVQNFKTKMVEVDCAAYNRVERLKAELTERMGQAKEFAQKGTPLPQELKKRLEELKELVGKKGRFNIDSKHHLNALSQDNKIGLLKLASRGMQALKAEYKKMEAAGIDATGVQGGRFMVIHRAGTGLDTVYSVRELKEQVNVEGHGLVEKAVPHDLTDSVIARLSQEAFELDDIYPAPTSEEVKQIVEAFERSEEEGAKVLEQILGESGDSSSEGSTQAESTNAAAETKVEQRAEAVAESPQTSVTETVNKQTGEITETPVQQEQQAAPEQTVQQEVKKEEPKQEAAQTTVNPAAQSDADFLAELGVNLD